MEFICPICGEKAIYYGGDVAICSSGARLGIREIPANIIYGSRILARGTMCASTSITLNNPTGDPNWNVGIYSNVINARLQKR